MGQINARALGKYKTFVFYFNRQLRKHENYGTHLPLPRAVLCTPASRINQDVKTCSCGNARLLFSRHEDGEFDLGLEME